MFQLCPQAAAPARFAKNPFSKLPLDRLKVQSAKPICVSTAATELAFLRAANGSFFPILFPMAKIGLRVGEMVHLLIEEVDLDRS